MYKIEDLHEHLYKLNTVELCEMLIVAVKTKANPKMIEIIKIYLLKSLKKDGINY